MNFTTLDLLILVIVIFSSVDVIIFLVFRKYDKLNIFEYNNKIIRNHINTSDTIKQILKLIKLKNCFMKLLKIKFKLFFLH